MNEEQYRINKTLGEWMGFEYSMEPHWCFAPGEKDRSGRMRALPDFLSNTEDCMLLMHHALFANACALTIRQLPLGVSTKVIVPDTSRNAGEYDGSNPRIKESLRGAQEVVTGLLEGQHAISSMLVLSCKAKPQDLVCYAIAMAFYSAIAKEPAVPC